MSESGGSQPKDDSDEDIYKDFSDFNFGDELAKLEHSRETIKKEALDLSEQVKVLIKENEELRKSNEILKKNMSSLLKTAQAEVQRKDSMIEELRNKVDSFTFRRKNKITKDTFTSTQDLEISMKIRNGYEDSKNASDEKRSKSKECRSSSDSEKRFHREEYKRKDSGNEAESMNCDNNRKYGYYRDCTRRKSRHSDRNYEAYNKRGYENHFKKSLKKDEPDYRDTYSESNRAYLKYCSLDRRKRSRSSDRRFTYRRRSSWERRSERMEESPEIWRREKKEDVSEGTQRRRHSGKGSSSRERSKGSKESSLEPPKSRSSPEKDSGNRIMEISNKIKETSSVKIDNDESKKNRKPSEKEKNRKKEMKTSAKPSRIPKDENSSKQEAPSEVDKFNSKSPLDALYNEMIVSRSSSRFSKLGSGVNKPEPDFEETKPVKTNQQKALEEEEDEDWTLSFKNERRDTARPMTLYSKRMMLKLSEAKEAERLNTEEKTITQDKTVKEMQERETEKEPGELTDDENVIESSKEFQELTKVASIESITIEKPKETEAFKEPMTKGLNVTKKQEMESKVEESGSCNEVEQEIRDVIEYSPFKNNYKLIEISPIKPPDKEHVMELYHKRTTKGQVQKEVESSIFNLLSSLSGVPLESRTEIKETKVEEPKNEEGDSEKQSENRVEQLSNEKSDEKIEPKAKNRRNSKCKKSENKPEKEEKTAGEENKSEKSDEMVTPGETTQFLDFFLLTTSPSKPIVPGQPETPGKAENLSDSKSDQINSSSEVVEKKNLSISPKKENAKIEEERKKTKKNQSEKTTQKKPDKSKGDKKGKQMSKKENKNKPDGKTLKRKRASESETKTKKPKLENSPRKRTRSQQNSGNETDKPKPGSESETETKAKEDITTFEFFKPIAKKDSLETPTECKMTTMSVANIICLETPNKGVTNLKNLMINEQMILNVLDSKNSALCSPLMTPRRLLNNDLMLTDSEDDSVNKGNVEEEEEEEEEGGEMSESENSECESDSGASDFVDLL